MERRRRAFAWRVERDPLDGASAQDGIESLPVRILTLIAASSIRLEELKAALASDGHRYF